MSDPSTPDGDATRRIGPDAPPPADPGATQHLDRGATPDAGMPADATQQLDPTQARPVWEAEVPVPPGAQPGAHDPDAAWQDEAPPEEAEEGPSRRGRNALLVLLGTVLGFALAFLVVALATSGDEADPDVAASQERVAALEAQLDERDAIIADLEAQLAEAEAAAGERDEDIEAQRQALDDRAEQLDDRAAALDAREDALDERESAIADREQEAGATPTPDPDPGDEPDPGTDEGEGGTTLPDIDTDEIAEEVGNVVEQVLDWLRGLFD